MKQIAFVTGSSRGIGREIAIKLAKSGYKVVIHGSKITESLKEVEKEIKVIGEHALTVCFDVSDPIQVSKYCRLILEKTNGVSVVINNSGIARDKTFVKMSNQEWDEVIKTNLYGPFYVTKQLLPAMIDRSFGRIINISSIAASGAFGKANYSAAKAGLIGLTKSLALETAKYNITVNAVCPGLIESGMSTTIPYKYQKQILSRIAMGRSGSAQEVAQIVSFLVNKESSYITGAVIDVNGGWF